MIKSSSLIGILALIMVLSLQTSLVMAADPEISLILTKQTPYPVEPGQIVDIEVSLQNNGSSVNNMIIEILPKDPFTLLPGQDRTKTFARISSYDSVTHSYKLKVNESAISAVYELEFRYYRAEATSSAVVKKVLINVQGTPKIVILGIETKPESMEPGDEVEITVNMKNEGTGKARQTELSLVAEANSETGESLIVPALAGGFFYLGEFLSGQQATARFKLEIDTKAEYKTYMSTMTVGYKDENGETQTTSFSIGLPVRGKPVIEVLSAKMDNSAFKVDIENIGTANAKALNIALIQDNAVKDSAVANELKPTKHKTMRFNGFRYGEALINISYLDEGNKLSTRETPVTITKSEYSVEGSTNDTSGLAIALFIVVVLESYYVWRLRKRIKK